MSSTPFHAMALAFTCACLLLAPILLGALFCVLLVGVTLVTPLAFAALCVLSLAHITCHRRRKDIAVNSLHNNNSNAANESRAVCASSDLPAEPRAVAQPAPTVQARGLASHNHTLHVLLPNSPVGDCMDSDDDSAHPGSAPVLSPASSAPCDSPPGSQHSTAPASPDALAAVPEVPRWREALAAASCHDLGHAAAGPATPVPDAPMDGTWLATCVFERRLGQGASGQVDQVLVRPSSGAPFMAARKRMPANRASALLLANELAALRAGAGCPNIVQLYDVRTTDAHVEVLLELVEGGSVADELVASTQQHGRPLSADRLRQVATDCLRGLDHLHRRGVCAGDVKPENLLVRSAGGQVVLADFGLSTLSDASGRLHSQVWAGTYGYVAPEAQALGEWAARPTPQLHRQQAQHGRGQQQGTKAPAAGCGAGASKQQPAKRPTLTVKVDVWALGRSLWNCAEGLGGPGSTEAGTPGGALLRAFLDALMEPLPAKRPTAGRALRHPFLAQQQQQQQEA